jgi:hypothetical protein
MRSLGIWRRDRRTTLASSTRPLDNERSADASGVRRVFRALITVHALEVFAQAVLAGGFLNGNYAMLGLHRDNAIGLVVLGYVQVLVAGWYWRARGGPVWLLWVCVGLSVVETGQFFLGLGRLIGLHVPLGVAIVVGVVLLAQWAWRPVVGGPRDPGSP